LARGAITYNSSTGQIQYNVTSDYRAKTLKGRFEAGDIIDRIPVYIGRMNGATEDWINVHVHGQYGRSLVGRAVYENTFKREFHVAKEPLLANKSAESTILIGMDFGRTPAAVMGQRHYTGRINVLDSLYVENIGLERFLNTKLKPLLQEKFPYNKYHVVGDPAGVAKSQLGEENAFDVLKKCGFTSARPAVTNDVDRRIQAVETLLAQQVDGKAMFMFSPEVTSPGMKHLIAGLDGGYMYKRKTNGSYDTSPEKNQYSHDNDALQYLALGANLQGGSQFRSAAEIKPAPRRWGCR
jgi:hypothetical protein